MKTALIVVIAIFIIPTLASAQYAPLVGLPYVNGNQDIGSYVNALYLLAIAIAAFLAVIKIIFAGVQYMLSDVVTDKGQAKKDIKGALLGLLIVLAAVLVLETINPSLTDLNVLKRAQVMEFSSTGAISLGTVSTPVASVESLCATYGDDNCLQLSCDASRNGYITAITAAGTAASAWYTGLFGAAAGGLIANDTAELGCESVCDFLLGQIADNETCVYPRDAAAAEQSLEAVVCRGDDRTACQQYCSDYNGLNTTQSRNLLGVIEFDNYDICLVSQDSYNQIVTQAGNDLCPAGQSCTTTGCNNDVTACQNSCASQPGYLAFDPVTRACVTDTQQANRGDTCLAGGGAVIGGSGQCRMTQSECTAARGSFGGLGTFEGFPNEGICTLN